MIDDGLISNNIELLEDYGYDCGTPSMIIHIESGKQILDKQKVYNIVKSCLTMDEHLETERVLKQREDTKVKYLPLVLFVLICAVLIFAFT